MRLFIALDFDNEDYFLGIQEQLPKDTSKMVPTKTFHLTLKFLGEVPDEKADEIKERLSKVDFEPLLLTTDRIGVFPNEDYVKVIWLGIKEQDAVKQLQQKVEKSLLGLFGKDDRFHPHITLARVKFVNDKALFKEQLSRVKVDSKQFSIKSFKLVKSTLTGEGPVYETLEEFS